MRPTTSALVARVALLCATLAYAAFVTLLGLTPIAWEAAGRPAESYPELFYLGFGWPSALALLAANSVLWATDRRMHRPASTLMWIGLVLLIWLCALVAATGILSLSRSGWTPSGVLEAVAAFSVQNFFVLLFAAAACVIAGAAMLLRAPRRPT